MDRKERDLLTSVSVLHAVSDAWHFTYPSLIFLVALDYNNYFFLGILANIIVASRAISGLFAGILADQYSNRLMFAAFALLSALGAFMVVPSHHEALLALSLLVFGVGMGIYHPVGLSAITRNIRRRSEALGIHAAAGAVGLSIFPVVLVSVGVAVGWRASFLVVGVVSLILLTLLPLVPKEFDRPRPAHSEGKTTPASALALLSQKPVLAIFVTAALWEAAMIGFTTFLPAAIALIGGLGQARVAGISTTGLFISFVVLVGAIGSFMGGKLGQHFTPERVLTVLILVPIPVLLLLGAVKGNTLLALAPLVMFVYNAGGPLVNTLIGKYVPAGMQGKGFAVLYGLGPGVGSLVLLLAGAISQSYGLNWVFPLVTVFLLAAFPVPYFVLLPAQRRREEAI